MRSKITDITEANTNSCTHTFNEYCKKIFPWCVVEIFLQNNSLFFCYELHLFVASPLVSLTSSFRTLLSKLRATSHELRVNSPKPAAHSSRLKAFP